MNDAAALPTGGIDRVLIVCSANQCRSPLGAAVLARRLRERALLVAVASVGTQAVPESQATPPTVAAAGAIGLDLAPHRSRLASADMVQTADLILGMERHHVREAVLLDPRVFSRTFTLKELVRRGTDVGARPEGEPGATWLARVHEGRRSIDLVGSSPADDVADPTINRMIDHGAMATEIDELMGELVNLVWPGPG